MHSAIASTGQLSQVGSPRQALVLVLMPNPLGIWSHPTQLGTGSPARWCGQGNPGPLGRGTDPRELGSGVTRTTEAAEEPTCTENPLSASSYNQDDPNPMVQFPSRAQKTFCAGRRPSGLCSESRWDARDIWRSRKYLPCGLWGSAVLSQPHRVFRSGTQGPLTQGGASSLCAFVCGSGSTQIPSAGGGGGGGGGGGVAEPCRSWPPGPHLGGEGLVTSGLCTAHRSIGSITGPQRVLNGLPTAEALVAMFSHQRKRV